MVPLTASLGAWGGTRIETTGALATSDCIGSLPNHDNLNHHNDDHNQAPSFCLVPLIRKPSWSFCYKRYRRSIIVGSSTHKSASRSPGKGPTRTRSIYGGLGTMIEGL